MAEEKFISIDYTTWNTKYKPMENRIKDLEEALAREKEDKQYHIYLKVVDWSYFTYVRYDARRSLISLEKHVAVFEYGEPDSVITDIDAIYNVVRNIVEELSIAKELLLTKEAVKSANEEIKNYYEEAKELYNNNLYRISKIPKLIRWLFKIKS